MFDGEAIGAQMVEIVRGYVAAELEPLRAELKAAKEENASLVERLAAVESRELPNISGLCSIDEAKGYAADALAGLTESIEAMRNEQRAANEIIATSSAGFAERLTAVEARELPDAVKLCEAAAKALMDEISPVIQEYVAAETTPLNAKVETMAETNVERDARLAELEAQFNERMVETAEGVAKSDELLGQLNNQIGMIERTQESLADAYDFIKEMKAQALDEGPGEVDMDAVASLVSETVAKAVADIPVPKDGADCDMAAVREMVDEFTQQAVSEQLTEAVSHLPPPEKGEPGRDVDMEEVGQRIEHAVKSAVAALPAPSPGEPGKDGLGLADALIDHSGGLVLTMTDGTTKNLGQVKGNDGLPGKDGETFTLDDFDIEPLDERSIKLKFTKDDVCHSFELEFPVPIYRGVFSENETYVRADMTTWAGCLWHCNEPKGMKPGEPDSGWVMAAKKGRDGRDFKAAA